MNKPVSDLLQIFREKAARPDETAPYWGLGTEPTNLEICDAIHKGNLIPPIAHHAGHQGADKSFHIGKIAWFVKNWSQEKEEYLVKASDHDIDGGHRLYAARFLGIEELEVRPL